MFPSRLLFANEVRDSRRQSGDLLVRVGVASQVGQGKQFELSLEVSGIQAGGVGQSRSFAGIFDEKASRQLLSNADARRVFRFSSPRASIFETLA